MRTLVIDTQAIRSNIGVVRQRTRGAAIYGVLIGDAYGTGLVEAARLMREEGIGRFAVDDPSDAAELRGAGFVDEEILMLRSTDRQEELEQLMDLNVVCTVGSYEAGMALNSMAKQRSTAAEAHVSIDTGMGYGGFPAGELDKILSVYRHLSNVAISGLYTQIYAKASDHRAVAARMERLFGVVTRLREAGYEPGAIHASCSYPLFQYNLSRLDALQIGAPFFGYSGQSRRESGLKPVSWAKVTIDEVRWLSQGQTAGARSPVMLKKPTKIAVLPVGSFHGFCMNRQGEGSILTALSQWRAGRHPQVKIESARAKLLGRPGLTETIVDITRQDSSAGETAILAIDPRYARGFTREYR